MELKHLKHPSKCFCQFNKDDLIPWIDKRYHKNIPTIDLLDEATSEEEKEIVSIVALLDVDEHILYKIMDKVDMPKHHILNCRDEIKDQLNLEKID